MTGTDQLRGGQHFSDGAVDIEVRNLNFSCSNSLNQTEPVVSL
jgi:hypothetical protein